MKTYALPPDPETLAALNDLSCGVVSGVISKSNSDPPICFLFCLELSDGRWIELTAISQDLEYKFEVFALCARRIEKPEHGVPVQLILPPSVCVTPLVTESWLDPGVPIDFPTYGSDPVMQSSGIPGSAPATASMSCQYLGGVEIACADGSAMVIATGVFPCSLHVAGYCEDMYYDRNGYVAFAGEA